MRRSSAWLLLGAFTACAGPKPPALPPFERARFDAIFASERKIDALLTIDRLADEAMHPAGAAWLFAVQFDATRDVRQRSCAAAALASLGYPDGEAFCLALLGANLDDFAASDEEHALPRIDRWAFAREIALASLRGRCREAGVDAPDYDVNYGAPQMSDAAKRFRSVFAKLPERPRPHLDAELGALIPIEAPDGVAPTVWRRARAATLAKGHASAQR